jgi:hypothetical protein
VGISIMICGLPARRRVEREEAERLVGSLLHLSWIGGRKQPAGVD